MSADLPKMFYGDPANCIDALRRLREKEKRKAEIARKHKRRRIQWLVKKVLGKGKHLGI
jgi:hypothetical protein